MLLNRPLQLVEGDARICEVLEQGQPGFPGVAGEILEEALGLEIDAGHH